MADLLERTSCFSNCCELRGINGNAVMIGDRSEDIRAATSNGITGVGVLWGYGSERELLDAGAAAVCTTPAELAIYVADR
jgi:phosphoglycolate phosphatase